MTNLEIKQIYARHFKHFQSTGRCTEKTQKKKDEKSRIKNGFLLWNSRKMLRGQSVGNTFQGSLRDTFKYR